MIATKSFYPILAGACLRALACCVDAQPPASITDAFTLEHGKYQVVVDTTQAPELTDWARTELRPVIEKWYPQIVALLPGTSFEAPRRLTVIFQNDPGGPPAYTMRDRISCNIDWFKHNLRGEARGAVVHEIVHVVQHYGEPRPGGEPVPGWVVEGIADYIRWFLYEPQSHGTDIPKPAASRVHFDDSYRTTANFLDWICTTRDREFVARLNAICREGRYQESVWKTLTGKTAPELGAEWRTCNEPRGDASGVAGGFPHHQFHRMTVVSTA